MGYAVTAGEDVLGIDRDDSTAVVTHDFLHLPVHGAAAVGIEFGAGLNQQIVEAFVIPVGVIPGGIGCVGGMSKHQPPDLLLTTRLTPGSPRLFD